MSQLRVIAEYYDQAGELVLDGKTGQPKRNHIPVWFNGRTYHPGDTLPEMSPDRAEQELRVINARSEGVPPILERADAHREREARRTAARAHMTDDLQRVMRENQASLEEAARLREKVAERDFSLQRAALEKADALKNIQAAEAGSASKDAEIEDLKRMVRELQSRLDRKDKKDK